MHRIFKKIFCFTAAAVAAVGIFSASACGNNYKAKRLSGDISGTVSSNGGFAVEKGNYVYYVNGKQTNTADNTFGTPVKGAIMRISKADLAARNYSSVDTVVPHIAYSGNYNSGIYVYGDYVYYATPSTEKNSDGEVLNGNLAFKRTKLDGTDTMKDYYVQYSDNSVEYRYVAVGETVYLLYVATSETLYGESSGVTNLHSVNTSNGENTLLAYNVSAVTFDKNDLTNPRVYYTMQVPDFVSGATSKFSAYNQVYTVTADATERNSYNFEGVADYDAKDNPLYINCGKLVLDGIGKIQGMTNDATQFNGAGADKVERSPLTYTVSSYENGNLYYTRTSSKDTNTKLLFSVKDTEVTASGWNPVTGNPEDEKCLIRDGSDAGLYTYIYKDGALDEVLIASSDGFVKAKVNDGKIATVVDNVNRYNLTTKGQPTVLFTQTVEGADYIYYSLSGGSGYTVNRICIDGTYDDYRSFPVSSAVNEYTSVKILDLDSSSDWYKPELIENQILFPTEVEVMSDYSSYIMVCDLRGGDGKVMSNAKIDELNDKYEGIKKDIEAIDSTVYENLQNALWYAHYTGEGKYIDTLIKAYKDVMNYDEEHFWSKESVEKFKAFVEAKADGEWSKYSDTKKVNGVDVASNKLDYYYSLLGRMSDEDAESFGNYLKNTYLQSYPEAEKGWFESLSTGAKAGFIIGVCAGGLIVIAAAVVIPLVIIRKKKSKLPDERGRKIKVDTTDDKDIDVYSDEQ